MPSHFQEAVLDKIEKVVMRVANHCAPDLLLVDEAETAYRDCTFSPCPVETQPLTDSEIAYLKKNVVTTKMQLAGKVMADAARFTRRAILPVWGVSAVCGGLSYAASGSFPMLSNTLQGTAFISFAFGFFLGFAYTSVGCKEFQQRKSNVSEQFIRLGVRPKTPVPGVFAPLQ